MVASALLDGCWWCSWWVLGWCRWVHPAATSTSPTLLTHHSCSPSLSCLVHLLPLLLLPLTHPYSPTVAHPPTHPPTTLCRRSAPAPASTPSKCLRARLVGQSSMKTPATCHPMRSVLGGGWCGGCCWLGGLVGTGLITAGLLGAGLAAWWVVAWWVLVWCVLDAAVLGGQWLVPLCNG